VKRLSTARIEALSLSIAAALAGARDVSLSDRGKVVATLSERLTEAFQIDPALDRAVRARIQSLRRAVPEGSREWDLLYQQYLDDLSRRR
jgi:hypothetical protein